MHVNTAEMGKQVMENAFMLIKTEKLSMEKKILIFFFFYSK